MPSPLSSTRHAIVLNSLLRLLRPLVRLLLRHGGTYPEFAAALKPVFLQAAREELSQRGMAVTDSALTLLSGVHRRDVRTLTRGPAAPPGAAAGLAGGPPLSLSGEVVGRWMTDAHWAGRPLSRVEFDGLAAQISQDVRPRALLDELQRLGAVTVNDAGQLTLAANGFAPRQGFAEMAELLAVNLGDHAAAAAANLQGDENFLEQAMYVDELRPESVAQVRRAAVAAWQQALKPVLQEAQARFDDDALHTPPAQRRHRARFGVYFFSEEEPPAP